MGNQQHNAMVLVFRNHPYILLFTYQIDLKIQYREDFSKK